MQTARECFVISGRTLSPEAGPLKFSNVTSRAKSRPLSESAAVINSSTVKPAAVNMIR